MMGIKVLTTGIVLAFLLYVVSIFPNAYSKALAQVNDVQITQLKGDVLKIEDRRVTIETNDGAKEFEVPSNIKITLNGRASDLSALSPNDELTVSTTPTGEVLELSAVSGEAADRASDIIPILLALLVIGMGVYLVTKKMNRPKIKTEV